MFLEAVGSLLPAAAGIALSPFPIIAVVLVLGSPHGRRRGVAFAAGWLVGLSILTAVVVGSVEAADDESSTRAAVDWLRVAVGAALFYGAWVKWRTRPRGDEEPKLPGWMASLDGLSSAGAVRLGALLGGVNPKNVAFTLAAGAAIAELVDGGADQVAAAAVFVALASMTVVGAVAVQLLAGARGEAALVQVRVFMVRNANVVTMVVLLVLGAKVLGDGLAALAD